jgi:hypothetical protein
MEQWINDYAHWVLAVIGVSGIYFVGRKTLWGWSVLLFNETLWTVYGLVTKQYGFIVSAVAYGLVYIKSYKHWKELDSDLLSWKSFTKLVWDNQNEKK